MVNTRFLILLFLLLATFGACRRNLVTEPMLDQEVFFDRDRGKEIMLLGSANLGEISAIESDQLINKTIAHLKQLDKRDNFVGRVKNKLGLPDWNKSIVTVGGDGIPTTITPVFDTGKNIITGVIFGFHENNKFNARVFPRRFAKKIKDFGGKNTKHISKQTIELLFKTLENAIIAKSSGNEPVNSAYPQEMLTEVIYWRCWQVTYTDPSCNCPHVVYQCHKEVFWGSWEYWDFYAPNDPEIQYSSGGYYESYQPEEIERGQENKWEKERIDTSGLNDCLKKVLNGLIMNDTSDIGRTLRRFNYEPHKASFINFDELDLEFGIIDSSNAAAHTITLSQYAYRIEFNKQIFEKCTDLYAAETLMHEALHAMMTSLILRARAQFSNPPQWSDVFTMSYPQVFDTYVTYIYQGMTDDTASKPSLEQHDYMANHLVNTIANALAEYDGHRLDQEYYWSLSWGGLFQSATWQRYNANPEPANATISAFKYPLTRARMDKIKNVDYNEQEGNVNAKSVKHNVGGCY